MPGASSDCNESRSNASPSITSLFSEPGSRGDTAVAENLPRLKPRENQDIDLPVPGSMSPGNIETRGAKGTEVNEVAVEDNHTNLVKKIVTL